MVAPLVSTTLLLAIAAAEPSQLVRLLPDNANALIVVEFDDVRTALETQSLTPPGGVPPWATTYVAGVDLLLAGPVARSATSVIELKPELDLQSIGLIPPNADRIEGLRSSADVRGATLVEITPGLVGVMRPADPDRMATWVKALRSATPRKRSYLSTAAALDADIVLALDLGGVFNAAELSRFVNAHEGLTGRDLADAAPLAEGLALSMTADQIDRLSQTRPVPATLRVDFSAAPKAEPAAVRDLVAAVLEEMFLAVPELREAEATRDGNAVLVTVPLTRASLQNIVSMATPPRYQPLPVDLTRADRPAESTSTRPDPNSAAPRGSVIEQRSQNPPRTPSQTQRDSTPAPSAIPADPNLVGESSREALSRELSTGPRSQSTPAFDPTDTETLSRALQTRRYYEELTGVLDKFEEAARNSKPQNRTVAWINHFTRDLQSIDERGVDRTMLAYGRAAEDAMRQLTASLQGQRVAVELAEKQLVYKYDYEPVYAPYRFNVFGPFSGVSVGGFRAGTYGPYGYADPYAPYGNAGFGIGSPAIGPGGGFRPPTLTTPGVLPPVTQIGTRKRVTDSNVRSIRRDQANAIQKAAEERLEVWTELRQQENDLRALLRDRYGDAWDAAGEVLSERR